MTDRATEIRKLVQAIRSSGDDAESVAARLYDAGARITKPASASGAACRAYKDAYELGVQAHRLTAHREAIAATFPVQLREAILRVWGTPCTGDALVHGMKIRQLFTHLTGQPWEAREGV